MPLQSPLVTTWTSNGRNWKIETRRQPNEPDEMMLARHNSATAFYQTLYEPD